MTGRCKCKTLMQKILFFFFFIRPGSCGDVYADAAICALGNNANTEVCVQRILED